MVFVYSWFANVTFLKAVCNAVYAADCKCLCANSVKFFEYSIPFSTNSNTQLSTLTMPGTICSDRSLGPRHCLVSKQCQDSSFTVLVLVLRVIVLVLVLALTVLVLRVLSWS